MFSEPADREIVAGMVESWRPISLGDCQAVSLMNRVDTKYLLPLTKLRALLRELAGGYRVMEIGGERLARYRNLYFDTPRLKMYLAHHNGVRSRFKLRQRSYVDSDLHFLEVKEKTNRARTVKNRVRLELLSRNIPRQHEPWVRGLMGGETDPLVPSIYNEFSRVTLVDVGLSERVTIDFGLRWSLARLPEPDSEQKWLSPSAPACLVELKRGGGSAASLSHERLRAQRVQPTAFSKYCIGLALLDRRAKRNLFKETLRKVQDPRFQ